MILDSREKKLVCAHTVRQWQLMY